MICQKCRADNPGDKKFCGECGVRLEAAPEVVAVPGDPGAFFCERHKKVATRVRCGHCDTPICPRCTVYGPVGARCRACARHRVAVRPMGVLHEAGRTISEGAQGAGRTVWYLAVWSFIISFIMGLFGGGHDT
jgi:hypothetical protein